MHTTWRFVLESPREQVYSAAVQGIRTFLLRGGVASQHTMLVTMHNSIPTGTAFSWYVVGDSVNEGPDRSTLNHAKSPTAITQSRTPSRIRLKLPILPS